LGWVELALIHCASC